MVICMELAALCIVLNYFFRADRRVNVEYIIYNVVSARHDSPGESVDQFLLIFSSPGCKIKFDNRIFICPIPFIVNI